MHFQHDRSEIVLALKTIIRTQPAMVLSDLYRVGARFYIDSGAAMVGMSIGNPYDLSAHPDAESYRSVGAWVAVSFKMPVHSKHPTDETGAPKTTWCPKPEQIRRELRAGVDALADNLLDAASAAKAAMEADPNILENRYVILLGSDVKLPLAA